MSQIIEQLNVDKQAANIILNDNLNDILINKDETQLIAEENLNEILTFDNNNISSLLNQQQIGNDKQQPQQQQQQNQVLGQITTPIATNNNTNNNSLVLNSKTQSPRRQSAHDSGEETEEENEVIEESSDGRWAKRNKKVNQNDIPAIDHSYVAMDTENGYEVVWNEIEISKKRCSKLSEPTLKKIFTNLMNINHANIIKFHHYWEDIDKNNSRRIVFITEYMPSGSLKQFLRKAKKTDQPIKRPTWRRWCVQLLTALHYLHNCEPPIIHRELSSDTVFIQQSGLIKVGCIAPDIVHTHVKTRDPKYMKSIEQFMAPELLESTVLVNNSYGPPVDIYSFGMIALEMFNIDLGGNGDTHQVTPELIEQCINNLEDEKQQDFIRLCLKRNPNERPTAYQLLFHPLIFEFPSLKLLTAHKFVKTHLIESADFNFEYSISEYRNRLNARNLQGVTRTSNELIPQYGLQRTTQDDYIAFLIYDSTTKKTPYEYRVSINKCTEDLNKYLDDVKSGLYPLIINLSYNKPSKQLDQIKEELLNGQNSQSNNEPSNNNNSINNYNNTNKENSNNDINTNNLTNLNEKRRAQMLSSSIKDEPEKNRLVITMKFDDKTKRSIETSLLDNDTPKSLTEDLISNGLVNEVCLNLRIPSSYSRLPLNLSILMFFLFKKMNREDLLRVLGDCFQNTRR